MDNATRQVSLGRTSKARALPKELGFGRIFADKMFRMRYTAERGWHDATVCPYGPLDLDPAARVLHYGQEIFEGHKAYRWADGRVALFRPDANAARMNRSAERMRMPKIAEELQVRAITDLVAQLHDWVPDDAGSSLYIRPTMIATEKGLGVRPATEFLYYVIVSPVGPYFPQGFSPIRVFAEDKYVRAVAGGTGGAKCGGNYAGSLAAQAAAKEKGYDAVLWLDAAEHRYVEEIGAMNVGFVVDGQLMTSPLTGSILAGITRDSVLTLARDNGRGGVERRLAIDEIVEGISNGTVTEAFGIGTAAVITPIGWLGWKGQDYEIQGGQVGEMAQGFYDELTDIQYGRAEDRHGWMKIVE